MQWFPLTLLICIIDLKVVIRTHLHARYHCHFKMGSCALCSGHALCPDSQCLIRMRSSRP